MECLGQLSSIVPCLWQCSNKHLAYIRHLEDNLNSMRIAIDELNKLSEDVKIRVREAEDQRMKRTNQVNGWLDRVEAVNNEVNQVLEKGTQEVKNECVVGCCPKNCLSSYKLGKKVRKMLTQVKELKENGKFGVIANQLPPPPVDELPMEGPVVGFESNFQKLWQTVQDKNSSIIGLVGTGGVGKTTLLNQLNNELSKTNLGFNLVIWIVVSQPADLGRIRDTIRKKLNISDPLWESQSEGQRISLIRDKLEGKMFVLLLDDLWERLDLSNVGISIPQRGAENMSKVVLTTRSEQVCRFMEAHQIVKVGSLPQVEALKLFKSKVGEDVLNSHPELQHLVEDVASECAGLPLALITIGRAMRGKTDAQKWRDAKRMLKTYPTLFPGVEDEIFLKLVFSYDCLPTPTIQKCFEYCSIFPEDHEILDDELIGLWIAEGIIDEYGDMYDARIQGRQIIESLTQACLLEEVAFEWANDQEECVKMHDVIRDMALWLVCERGEKKNKFRVNVIVGDHAMSAANRADKWKNAERVSLWGNTGDTTFKSLTGLSGFSNLVTLIIKNNWKLEILPGEVFQSMKVLKVLNLSNNQRLIELPAEIGGLLDLEYLNIRATSVRRLPEEVKQLKKLKFFQVSRKTAVSREIMSSLKSLQAFGYGTFLDAAYFTDYKVKAMEGEMLKGLEELKHMMDLCIHICSAASVQILFKSQNLQRCTRHLKLTCGMESFPDVLDFSTMEHLERLHLDGCHVSRIKFGSSLSSLRGILIDGSEGIRNVSSLVCLPNLCALRLIDCLSMKELIGEDGMSENSINLFPSLTRLVLNNLPKLWRICPQSALPFPSLKRASVWGCDNLKRLPFDSNTANTIPPEFKITGERKWWDSLQWDTQATKDAFTPKFKDR